MCSLANFEMNFLPIKRTEFNFFVNYYRFKNKLNTFDFPRANSYEISLKEPSKLHQNLPPKIKSFKIPHKNLQVLTKQNT